MTPTHPLHGARRWFRLSLPRRTTDQQTQRYVAVETDTTLHELSRFPRQRLVVVERPIDANTNSSLDNRHNHLS